MEIDYEREIHNPMIHLPTKPKEFTTTYTTTNFDTYVVAKSEDWGCIENCIDFERRMKKHYSQLKQANERIHTNGSFGRQKQISISCWELKGTSDIFIPLPRQNKRVKTGLRVFRLVFQLGDKIAAVEIDARSMYSIVVFNSATKEIIARYPSPNQEYF